MFEDGEQLLGMISWEVMELHESFGRDMMVLMDLVNEVLPSADRER
jgi:hypothetical protein